MEQSLGLLTLHLFWKKQEMGSGSHLLEDAKYMETFLAQRAALMEKLSEYAIGAPSNAVSSVRQAVSLHLIHK